MYYDQQFSCDDPSIMLKNKIFEDHFMYLEKDNQQIDTRKNIEKLIEEYLNKVEARNRFHFQATYSILNNSINDDSVNEKNLAYGFDLISMYANNLYKYPWRKEYHTIRMYSGFFQHEIMTNLNGAEALFFEMGYQKLPNELLVLVGGICAEQVRNVSRDALLAHVECNILMDIHKTIKSAPLKEIYDFRQKLVGNKFNFLKQYNNMKRNEKNQGISSVSSQLHLRSADCGIYENIKFNKAQNVQSCIYGNSQQVQNNFLVHPEYYMRPCNQNNNNSQYFIDESCNINRYQFPMNVCPRNINRIANHQRYHEIEQTNVRNFYPNPHMIHNPNIIYSRQHFSNITAVSNFNNDNLSVASYENHDDSDGKTSTRISDFDSVEEDCKSNKMKEGVGTFDKWVSAYQNSNHKEDKEKQVDENVKLMETLSLEPPNNKNNKKMSKNNFHNYPAGHTGVTDLATNNKKPSQSNHV